MLCCSAAINSDFPIQRTITYRNRSFSAPGLKPSGLAASKQTIQGWGGCLQPICLVDAILAMRQKVLQRLLSYHPLSVVLEAARGHSSSVIRDVTKGVGYCTKPHLLPRLFHRAGFPTGAHVHSQQQQCRFLLGGRCMSSTHDALSRQKQEERPGGARRQDGGAASAAVAAAAATTAATLPPEAAEAAAATVTSISTAAISIKESVPVASDQTIDTIGIPGDHGATALQHDGTAATTSFRGDFAAGSTHTVAADSTKNTHVLSVDRSGMIGMAHPHLHPHQHFSTKERETEMARHIKALVRFRSGPVTVAEYMSEALTNPNAGYYIERNVFGRAGDFVTSPEISQMFGEMLGIWVVTVWQSLGSPPALRLVELGPGRGTLMADALRGTAPLKGFAAALSVDLVEVSSTLREQQWAALECEPSAPRDGGPVDAGMADDRGISGLNGAEVRWHHNLEQVPVNGPPTVYLANEFFDALPVHQLQRNSAGRWSERLVDVCEDEGDPRHLRFVVSPGSTPASSILSPAASIACAGRDAIEFSPQSAAVAASLAERVMTTGGAALIVDYGNPWAAADSLRGIRDHKFVHPLDMPGEADLSADVDFNALRTAAETSGATVYGPIPQSDLLAALGIGARLESLQHGSKSPKAAKALSVGYNRLMGTESGPAVTAGSGNTSNIPSGGGMGHSYKAIVITSPELPQPVAFEGAATSAADAVAAFTPPSDATSHAESKAAEKE